LNQLLNRSEELIELSIKNWAEKDDEPELKELQALAKARKRSLALTRTIATNENDNLKFEENGEELKNEEVASTGHQVLVDRFGNGDPVILTLDINDEIVINGQKYKVVERKEDSHILKNTKTGVLKEFDNGIIDDAMVEKRFDNPKKQTTNTPKEQPTKGHYEMPILIGENKVMDYYSDYVQKGGANFPYIGKIKFSDIQNRNYSYRDSRLSEPITIVPHETPLLEKGEKGYDCYGIYLGNIDEDTHFVYDPKRQRVTYSNGIGIDESIRATYLESALAEERGTTINQTTTTYIDNSGVTREWVVPILPLPSYFHTHIYSNHGHGPMPIPPPPPKRGNGRNYGRNRQPAPTQGPSIGGYRPTIPTPIPQIPNFGGKRPPSSKPQNPNYGGTRPTAPKNPTPNNGGNHSSKPITGTKWITPTQGSGPSIGGYRQTTPTPKLQTPKQNFNPQKKPQSSYKGKGR
jgi:hypothetical protein